MLSMPSLLLLPLLDAVCSYSLYLLLILSVPALLSTVELSAKTFMGIEGLFRTPKLGAEEVLRVTTVIFACFWVQAVASNIRYDIITLICCINCMVLYICRITWASQLAIICLLGL